MSYPSRHNTSPTVDYSIPFNKRTSIPISRSSHYSTYQFNEKNNHEQINSKDTTLQWIYDSTIDKEIFRIKIHIEGFNQNEVHTRVDGNKLFIYGERIENKTQGLSKIILEKSYNLPSDVDTHSSHITYPSPITMQIDFTSKHPSAQTIQLNNYSLPQKLNKTKEFTSSIIHSSNDKSPYHKIPIVRVRTNSTDSSILPVSSNESTIKFRSPIHKVFIDEHKSIYKKPLHQNYDFHSNQATGIESSREHSESPVPFNITQNQYQYDGDLNHHSITPSSITDKSDLNNVSSIFPQDFNADVFYKSIFYPKVHTDDHDQRYIEMNLDMYNYDYEKIQVSFNDNDLVVQIDGTNFYKQITLPSNIDLSSLSLNYNDRTLNIKIKLLDEYSSFKYI